MNLGVCLISKTLGVTVPLAGAWFCCLSFPVYHVCTLQECIT